MDIRLAKLMEGMIAYDKGDARRAEHLVKVFGFSSTIGTLEGLSARDLFILEAASIVHDIGIHVSEGKPGGDNGPNQQTFGPPEARKLMGELGCFSPEEIEGVCFLIARHHTYKDIDTLPWQILVEADFIVNLFENGAGKEEIGHVRKTIFKTKTGLALYDAIFSDVEKQASESRMFQRKDGVIFREKRP